MSTHRRNFLAATASLTSVALRGSFLFGQSQSKEEDSFVKVGPMAGYSPQIGTLVSMLGFMREQIVDTVAKMTQSDLDYLLDAKANTIGALLLHLAATDTLYHLHTFGEKPWGSWDESVKKQWDIPMELGEPARQTIKGHNVKYYLDILAETRAKTLAEFAKRDDKWLLQQDKVNPGGWGNYYAEWFHVCEHESNHRGQMKFIAVRLPGAKANQPNG